VAWPMPNCGCPGPVCPSCVPKPPVPTPAPAPAPNVVVVPKPAGLGAVEPKADVPGDPKMVPPPSPGVAPARVCCVRGWLRKRAPKLYTYLPEECPRLRKPAWGPRNPLRLTFGYRPSVTGIWNSVACKKVRRADEPYLSPRSRAWPLCPGPWLPAPPCLRRVCYRRRTWALPGRTWAGTRSSPHPLQTQLPSNRHRWGVRSCLDPYDIYICAGKFVIRHGQLPPLHLRCPVVAPAPKAGAGVAPKVLPVRPNVGCGVAPKPMPV
jgi:hypothetical protein